MRALALILASLMLCATAAHAADAVLAQDDPFIWLEDVNSARSMDWVKAENAKSLGVLEADSRFPALHAQAMAIAEAKPQPAPAKTRKAKNAA